jgi:hypothetical protein
MRRFAAALVLVAVAILPTGLRAATFGPRSIELAIDPALVRVDGLGGGLRVRVGGSVAEWCRIEETLGYARGGDLALKSTTVRACLGSFEDEGVFFIVGYGHGWGHESGDPRGDRDAPVYEIGLGSGGQLSADKRATFRFELTLSGSSALDRQVVPAAAFGFGWLLGPEPGSSKRRR